MLVRAVSGVLMRRVAIRLSAEAGSNQLRSLSLGETMRKIFAAVSLGLAVLPLLLHGQTTETQRFQALMSSTQENSAALVGYQAMGSAVVEFFLKRDAQGALLSAVTDFRIEHTFGQAETVTNMHIHRGAVGIPGPVVVPANFGAAVDVTAGSGAFFRAAQTTDPVILAVIEEVLANPGRFYVNVHSLTFPGGIMRGQLEWDPARAASGRDEALAAQIEAVKESELRSGQILRLIGLRIGVIAP